MGASAVIDVSPFAHCVCEKMGTTHELCDGALTLSEQGKKIRLSTRSGEDAIALVIDGCVIKDGKLKCDGLFLFLDNHRAAALLVELKGGDIRHAFEQLAYVQTSRPEYTELIARLKNCGKGRVIQKAFIVSNHMLSKTEYEPWENQYGVRITAILHCEATTPIPDLRPYLK